MLRRSCCATILTSTCLMTALSAVDLSNEDVETLKDWINSKRMVTVRELGGQLSISGDIHAEMQSANIKVNGEYVRGGDSYKPTHSYDVELNLSIDYRADRTWAAGRIRFDNDAGIVNDAIGSGRNDKLKVDRAYFGYRIYDGDIHTMDIEVGRRYAFNVWDSKIQYASNFDGVTLKDSYASEKVGDFYYTLGLFLVNEKREQFAYGSELGIMNIARTGFYTKYSIINWDTKQYKKIPHQFQFINSQLIVGYKCIPTVWDKLIHFYLAGLYNHRARPLSITDHSKAGAGGYMGVAVGQIKQSGDWSFETMYQVLQAQAVPDFDVLGVGLGSSSSGSFYYTDDDGDIELNTRKTAEGNVNYRGFVLNLQYLLTNNLNIFQEWKQAITLDNKIGKFRNYKQYEIDFIYSF